MFFSSQLTISKIFIRIASVVSLLVSGLLFSGCGEFLRGKKQSEQVMNVELAENACLKTIPHFLNSYFVDNATVAEIDQNFDCVQSALKTFLKYTRGEAADRYSDRELQHFFNRYLLSENQISDSFLGQVMKLKTLMLGGTSTAFTRTEIDQLSEALRLIRTQFKALRGLSSLLLFQKDPKDVSFEELKAAQSKVTEAATAVILSFKLGGSEFDFSDISSFVSELNSFTGSQGKLNDFLRWFPLMNSLKSVFLGQHPTLGSKADWTAAINWSVDAYFMGQEFYYHTRLLDLKNGPEWKVAIRWTDWVLDSIGRSPMMERKGYLATLEIDQMLKALVELKLVKINLSLDVIKNTYKKVIFHLIDGKREGRGETFEIAEINRSQLAVINYEYEAWRQSQIMISDLFGKQQALPVEKLLSLSQSYDKSLCVRTISANRMSLIATLDEWQMLMGQKRAVFFDTTEKLVLNTKPSLAKVSLNSMTLQAALRALTRLTLNGYGDGIGRDLFSTAMTEERIVDLEYNFREFGQAIGFLDPRQNGAPQRTFKEGNFFTFSGNGDLRLEGKEIYELLHFMISAGSVMTDQIEEFIEQARGHLAEKDVMNRAKSEEPVFRKVVEQHFEEIFSNMPLLLAAKKQMPRQEWSEIYSIVMQISRFDDAKFGVTEYAEIRSFTSIVQYVESLFIQFDTDASGSISVDELFVGEPRFHRLIKELSPVKADWFVREAFLYLVTYGKIPSLDSELWDFTKKRLKDKPLQPVTRLQLYRVLSVLKNNAL